MPPRRGCLALPPAAAHPAHRPADYLLTNVPLPRGPALAYRTWRTRAPEINPTAFVCPAQEGGGLDALREPRQPPSRRSNVERATLRADRPGKSGQKRRPDDGGTPAPRRSPRKTPGRGYPWGPNRPHAVKYAPSFVVRSSFLATFADEASAGGGRGAGQGAHRVVGAHRDADSPEDAAASRAQAAPGARNRRKRVSRCPPPPPGR